MSSLSGIGCCRAEQVGRPGRQSAPAVPCSSVPDACPSQYAQTRCRKELPAGSQQSFALELRSCKVLTQQRGVSSYGLFDLLICNLSVGQQYLKKYLHSPECNYSP